MLVKYSNGLRHDARECVPRSCISGSRDAKAMTLRTTDHCFLLLPRHSYKHYRHPSPGWGRINTVDPFGGEGVLTQCLRFFLFIYSSACSFIPV